ncbi:MAG: hypothetical protein LC737_08985, partial [Chloroflexi bacterium]|nr:hypothetical protein [Chloroflexota bacterium]
MLWLTILLLVVHRTTPEHAHAAPATTTAHLYAFHLLTAETGWLWMEQQLYWSDDGGQRWREITPPSNGMMRAVFFLDVQHGWVMSSDVDDTPTYTLARTLDGGRTWQTQSLTLDVLNAAPSSTIYLHFVDAQTGWLVLKHTTSSAFNEGTLFKTTDGGRTWTRLTIPVGEPVYFANAELGWTAGGAAGDALYRTQDGGQTWTAQRVTASSLEQRQSAHRPTFDNARDGVLPVVVSDERGTAVELYTTRDGGQSWQLASRVLVSTDARAGTHVPLSVRDAQHVSLAVPQRARLLHITNAREVQSVDATGDVSADIITLDMATDEVGWAKSARGSCAPSAQGARQCTQDVQLLRTHDGGRTWQPLALPASVSANSQTVTFTGQG